jgi:hypothetical protein
MGPIRPNTAWFWPNEWPNGEIHARDDERARGARNGRDRSYQHGVGGSSKQHERTGVTAGALSGQLAARLLLVAVERGVIAESEVPK